MSFSPNSDVDPCTPWIYKYIFSEIFAANNSMKFLSFRVTKEVSKCHKDYSGIKSLLIR